MTAIFLLWTELFLKLHIDFLLSSSNLPRNDLHCPARTPVYNLYLSFMVKQKFPIDPWRTTDEFLRDLGREQEALL